MSLYRIEFENEDDRRTTMDINLAMLEAEGWKPKEDLSILMIEDRVEVFKKRLDEAGITYRAIKDC